MRRVCIHLNDAVMQREDEEETAEPAQQRPLQDITVSSPERSDICFVGGLCVIQWYSEGAIPHVSIRLVRRVSNISACGEGK